MTVHDLPHIIGAEASITFKAHRVAESELDGLLFLVACSDDILAILRGIMKKIQLNN